VLTDTIKNQQALSQAGDAIVYGFMTGLVVEDQKAYDEQKYPGKVKVKFLTREKDKNIVIWIPVVMPAAGEDHGFFFTPEVGDVVLIGFAEGNFAKPYVMGCLYRDSDKVHKNAAHAKNNIKKIVTRGGNQIIFNDEAGDTDKSYIIIQTKEELMIKIENEKKLITIKDKDAKNQIVIDSPNGDILIQSDKKTEIKSGKDTSIVLDGENKSITMKSQSIKIEATNDLTLNGQSVKIAAKNTLDMEGKSSAAVKSTGSTKVSGSTVKFG